MRSLDQLSSGSSSCSPVLSDDSFEPPTRMFGRVPSTSGHSPSAPYSSRHLLMPARPTVYESTSSTSGSMSLSAHSNPSRFGLSFGELPVHCEEPSSRQSPHPMYSDRLTAQIDYDSHSTRHTPSDLAHHSTSSRTKSSSGVSSDCSVDFQRPTRGKLKICGVCGDRAKSFHFGAISCDSCKAFFRRSVQNEAYKNFHCPYNNRCDITILSRKCCQHCR
jgi:hypothetical protein